MENKFQERKARALESIARSSSSSSSGSRDKSRAGAVDARVLEIVNSVNFAEDIFTTSSCSGRASVFEDRTSEDEMNKRKGGRWVYVSHDLCEREDVTRAVLSRLRGDDEFLEAAGRDDDFDSTMEHALEKNSNSNDDDDDDDNGEQLKKTMTLRFEPFILAVECKNDITAQKFVKCARDAGYRESGTFSSTTTKEDEHTDVSGRITASARCAIRMEVPIVIRGKTVVNEDGIGMLVDACNEKMRANWERMERFLILFKERFLVDEKKLGNINKDNNKDRKHAQCWLLVDSLCAKSCKDALKENGWLDQSRKSMPASIEEAEKRYLIVTNVMKVTVEGENIAPTEIQIIPTIKPTTTTTKENGKKEKKPKQLPLMKSFIKLPVFETNDFVVLMDKNATNIWQSASPIHSAISKKLASFIVEVIDSVPSDSFFGSSGGKNIAHKSPAVHLATRLSLMLKQNGIIDDDIDAIVDADVPKKWEKLGDDLVLLPKLAFSKHYENIWKIYPPWEIVSQCLKVSRIFKQDAVSQGPKRESRAKSVFGASDGWVEHKELGVIYGFDCSKVMFSSGNGTEKKRMGFDINARNETIVDLYAGIGYYTMQLLKNGNVSKVYACEWNPNSCEYLRWNLKKNNVEDSKCVILDGDNREVAPRNVADRVLLGLLPTSREAWSVAVNCLKEHKGGICHVHECVDEGEFEKRGDEIVEAMKKVKNNAWIVRVEKVEKVKKYAPRVWHLVYDIVLRPKDGRKSLQKDSLLRNNISQPTIITEKKKKLSFEPVIRSHRPSKEDILSLKKKREPIVFSGIDIGSCAQNWTPTYLLQKSPTLANAQVSAHISKSANFDFARKNFKYETLTGANFLNKVSESSEQEDEENVENFLYLRSLGSDPRKFEPAMALEQFPELAKDVRLPSELWGDRNDEAKLHSVVLRVSSAKVKIWTHYDAMDNVLIQLSGTKRVVLFPPKFSGDLYLKESSSLVSDIEDVETNDLEYPRFRRALENALEVVLQPGDCLYIPALWAHRCESGASTASVALNTFFRDLDKTMYPVKDAYANADPILAQEALANIEESIVKLKHLPQQHGEFYASYASAKLAREFNVDHDANISKEKNNNKIKINNSKTNAKILSSGAVLRVTTLVSALAIGLGLGRKK